MKAAAALVILHFGCVQQNHDMVLIIAFVNIKITAALYELPESGTCGVKNRPRGFIIRGKCECATKT